MYEAPIFCTQCAARLEEQAVGVSSKKVPVCVRCGAVHWIDPKIAAGILIVRGDRVLLVKRGIEPGYGRWTFPGGHVDRGETLEEAALRETLEECGVTAELGDLLGAFSYPGRPVVIVIYRGDARRRQPRAARGRRDARGRLVHGGGGRGTRRSPSAPWPTRSAVSSGVPTRRDGRRGTKCRLPVIQETGSVP